MFPSLFLRFLTSLYQNCLKLSKVRGFKVENQFPKKKNPQVKNEDIHHGSLSFYSLSYFSLSKLPKIK